MVSHTICFQIPDIDNVDIDSSYHTKGSAISKCYVYNYRVNSKYDCIYVYSV